jgi:hypothetical protein
MNSSPFYIRKLENHLLGYRTVKASAAKAGLILREHKYEKHLRKS